MFYKLKKTITNPLDADEMPSPNIDLILDTDSDRILEPDTDAIPVLAIDEILVLVIEDIDHE